EEEWIAGGPLVQLGGESRARAPGREALEIAGDLVGLETLEVHPADEGLAHERAHDPRERMAGMELLVAIGPGQDRRRAAQLGREKAEQEERGLIAPVEVVEDDRERSRPRTAPEVAGHGIEELEALLLGGEPAGARLRGRLGELGEERRDDVVLASELAAE